MVEQADPGPGEGDPQPGESAAITSGVAGPVGRWRAPERIRGSIEWARTVAASRLDGMYADELAQVPGGPDLAYVLEAAHESRCHEATLVEAVAACERLAAWAHAQQAAYLQEIRHRRRDRALLTDGLAPHEDSRADAAEAAEIGARLRITPRAARAKVDLAEALDDFPDVHDALAAGLIDASKAEVLGRRPPGLGRGDHLRVVDALLPWAPRLTVPALKRRIAKLVIELAPQTALVRQREAYADRCVSIEPAGDGMAWLTAYLRADDAIAVRRTLDAMAAAGARVEQAGRRARGAREHPGEVGPESEGSGAVSGAEGHRVARTLDQLRADAFVSTFESLDRDHAVPSGGTAGSDAVPTKAPAVRAGGPIRRRAHRSAINVTISAATLAGLDELPAELAGYGAIPAPLGREIVREAQHAHSNQRQGSNTGQGGDQGPVGSQLPRGPSIRYLALDENGQPAAPSTATYRPGQALSAAVTAGEQYCTFPGCRIPAYYTDLDHIEPYAPRHARPGNTGTVEEPGEPQTRASNLQPLCRSHHNLKTSGLWTTRREDDGTLTWTSTSTGHTYHHVPEPPPGSPATGTRPSPQSHDAEHEHRCGPPGVAVPRERSWVPQPRAPDEEPPSREAKAGTTPTSGRRTT